MPILFWLSVYTFGGFLIGYVIYDVMIAEMTAKSKRKKHFNNIIDTSNQYRRYVKGGEWMFKKYDVLDAIETGEFEPSERTKVIIITSVLDNSYCVRLNDGTEMYEIAKHIIDNNYKKRPTTVAPVS